LWLAAKAEGRPAGFIDGTLVEVKARRGVKTEPMAAEKAQFYGELIWIGRERGYSDGWANHKFREKFGHGPRGDAAMREPRPETRSWVRSRQIAYAKGEAKKRAGTLL